MSQVWSSVVTAAEISSAPPGRAAVSTSASPPDRPPRQRPPVSLRRAITLASAFAGIAAIAVAAVAIATYRLSLENQHARRYHLLPALDAVEDLNRALIDQETGVRGYIITADPLFLTPYERGVTEQAAALATLSESLLPYYPDLYALVTPLIETARVWHDEIAQPEVDLVMEMRRDEAVEMVSTGRGLVVFDQLRTEVEALRSAIEGERDVTSDALSRRVDALFLVSLIGALVTLSVAVGLWILARRRVAAPLELLAEQAATVAAGRLDTPITAGGSVEIATVARSAEQMRVQLLSEITEAFSTGMVAAESAERARLAGDLHDDPIQVLTSAQWQLETLVVGLDGEQQEAAQQVVRSLNEVQGRLRTLMFRLHPPGLDDEGLAAALDDLVSDVFDGTGMVIDLRIDELGIDELGIDESGVEELGIDELGVDESGVSSSASGARAGAVDTTTVTLLFRIAAEAIRNVRKHAGASRIEVRVRGTGDGVQLSVIDDGIGSEAGDVSDGPHGIAISRALATAAGGWWQISSRPDHGTTVTCWLPSTAGRRHP